MTAADPRLRAGVLLVMLVYIVGYLTGRAGGQVDAAKRLIEAYGRARVA